MAKWGEGDPRWIVEERPDATNVNNWHWSEKNATPWSKDRIKSLFKDFLIASDGVEVKITEVEKIDGEATANNRKAKLIFFYEWNIVLKWSGKLPNEKDAREGKVTIPNLSEENDLDDIEITITVEDSDAESEKLKLFMYNKGRDVIRERLGLYVKELKEEYSKDLILPRKDGEKVKLENVTKTVSSGFNKKSENCGAADATNQLSQVNLGTKIDVKTLTLKQSFQCRANELYEALTVVEMVSAFTRSPAKCDAVKNGEFSLFGGNVTGKFLELVPNQKIVQTWRLKQWPAGHYSNVTINLEQKSDHTELSVEQTGVPKAEAQATADNWQRYYWNSIRQTFGFGSPLV